MAFSSSVGETHQKTVGKDQKIGHDQTLLMTVLLTDALLITDAVPGWLCWVPFHFTLCVVSSSSSPKSEGGASGTASLACGQDHVKP